MRVGINETSTVTAPMHPNLCSHTLQRHALPRQEMWLLFELCKVPDSVWTAASPLSDWRKLATHRRPFHELLCRLQLPAFPAPVAAHVRRLMVRRRGHIRCVRRLLLLRGAVGWMLHFQVDPD